MIELLYFAVFAIIAVLLFWGWHSKTQILINEKILTNKLLIELIKEIMNGRTKEH